MRSHLQHAVLEYLAHHCRGAARARKVWKIAEDLDILGVKATGRSVRAALRRLRSAGHPIRITSGRLARVYLARKPARRGSWPPPSRTGPARAGGERG